MRLKYNATRRFVIHDPGGDVTMIVRNPTPSELARYHDSSSEVGAGGSIELCLARSGIELVDSILLDVDGFELEMDDGRVVDLGSRAALAPEDLSHFGMILGYPVNSWKDLVPAGWKSQVALAFARTGRVEEQSRPLVN